MIKYSDCNLKQWSILKDVDDEILQSVQLVQVFGIDADSAFYITDNDEVFAIGNNLLFRLGVDSVSCTTVPIRIDELCGKSIICFTSGQTHALALSKYGEVYAWGSNSFGHIGNGSLEEQATPTKITFPDNAIIKEISSADRYNLALSVNNKLYHWGDIYWNCSRSNYQKTPTLLKVPYDVTVTSISCGTQHAAAVTNDGKVLTWGAIDFNPRQANEPLEKPTLVSGQIDDQFVLKVTCSCSATLALTEEGNLYAWGYNKNSSLSTGDKAEYIYTPQRVLFMKNIMDIASNNLNHILCAKAANQHKVYTWAYDDEEEAEGKKEFQTILDAFVGRAMPTLIRKDPPPPVTTAETVQQEKPQSSAGVSRDIGKALFNVKDHSDLTIALADGEVYVHSVIMKTFSEHFKTMLSDNWSNGRKVIDMRQYNPKAYRAFLQYIYTGALDYMEGHEIIALCDIAVSYFEGELKSFCKQMFNDLLNVHNVCQLYTTAVASHSELAHCCVSFASQSLEMVILSEGFEALEPHLCKTLVLSAVKLKNNML